MEFTNKKDHPPWYEYETNGPNDLFNKFVSIKDNDEYFKWINWFHWKEDSLTVSRQKDCVLELQKQSRNSKMIFFEEKWKSGNDKLLKSAKYCEPQYTGRCYELLCEWIPQQHKIFGCQYELSDLSIIDLLRGVNDVGILVSGGDWITGDCKSKDAKALCKARESAKRVRTSLLKGVRTHDELIKHSFTLKHIWDSFLQSQYFIYKKDDDYDHMHQKWLVGTRYEKLKRKTKNGGKYRSITSLIYSSYNITHNAKSNIESALYFPSISIDMATSLYADYHTLCAMEKTIGLPLWCDTNDKEPRLLYSEIALRPYWLALFTRNDKKAQYIQVVDNLNYAYLNAHRFGWKINEYSGHYLLTDLLTNFSLMDKSKLDKIGVTFYSTGPYFSLGWYTKDYFLKKLSRSHKISSSFKFIRHSKRFENYCSSYEEGLYPYPD